LSDATLREQITASTNKVEAYNGFAKWLNFGGEGVIEALAFEEQEKGLKYNHLVRIPGESDQRFRLKPITDSDGIRSVIPRVANSRCGW
jgi:hypothetical protein